jgi:alpha-mannosidase
VKRGEDDEHASNGDLPPRSGSSIICRIYDAMGGKCKGKLEWGCLPVKGVTKVNILEDDIEDDGLHIDIEKAFAKIELRAFEVATFRLQL